MAEQRGEGQSTSRKRAWRWRLFVVVPLGLCVVTLVMVWFDGADAFFNIDDRRDRVSVAIAFIGTVATLAALIWSLKESQDAKQESHEAMRIATENLEAMRNQFDADMARNARDSARDMSMGSSTDVGGESFRMLERLHGWILEGNPISRSNVYGITGYFPGAHEQMFLGGLKKVGLERSDLIRPGMLRGRIDDLVREHIEYVEKYVRNRNAFSSDTYRQVFEAETKMVERPVVQVVRELKMIQVAMSANAVMQPFEDMVTKPIVPMLQSLAENISPQLTEQIADFDELTYRENVDGYARIWIGVEDQYAIQFEPGKNPIQTSTNRVSYAPTYYRQWQKQEEHKQFRSVL